MTKLAIGVNAARAVRAQDRCDGISDGYQGGAGAPHQLHVRPTGARCIRTSSGCVRRRTPAPRSRPTRCTVEPADHFINWQQDAFGNFLARLVFPNRTRELTITVGLIADLKVINPFDFFIEEYAETFPLRLPEGAGRATSSPTCGRSTRTRRARGPASWSRTWVQQLLASPPGTRTIDFLVALNRAVNADVGYSVRMEPGVQTPDYTLRTGDRVVPRLGVAAGVGPARSWAWPPGSCPATWCS